MSYYYSLFNLIVNSDIELPELTPTVNSKYDVKITVGEVPNHLPKINGKGVLYELYNDDFLFNLESVGAFRVQNGNQISIQPNPNSSDEEFRIFLFGSCMGALLFQRGLLPIHASSVHYSSNALLMTGISAAGKSSLAAGLSTFGYSILSDDITALSRSKTGKFTVLPGIPYLRLWNDTIKHLDLGKTSNRIRPQLEKYLYSYDVKNSKVEIEPKTLVVLSSSNEKGYRVKELRGNEKFEAIRSSTYRLQYVNGLGLIQDHFKQISQLVSDLRTFVVERPTAPLAIRELSRFIINEIIERD